MTSEERFAWIRLRKQRYLSRAVLTSTTRGCMTGRVTKAIKTAADMLHIPVSNVRDIRLELAAEAFGRPVDTYNDLQDAELWALDQWVRLGRTTLNKLAEHLQQMYGEQPPLL